MLRMAKKLVCMTLAHLVLLQNWYVYTIVACYRKVADVLHIDAISTRLFHSTIFFLS